MTQQTDPLTNLVKINNELDDSIELFGGFSDKEVDAVIDLIMLENDIKIKSLIVENKQKIRLLLKDILTNDFKSYPKFKDKLNIYKLLSGKENN